jgi:hypothetical protein
MKIKKLFLMSAFAIALTTSFAFKAVKGTYDGSIFVPGSFGQCATHMLIDNDCSVSGEGARCTAYWNSDHPTEPAYYGDLPTCTYPLYHQF